MFIYCRACRTLLHWDKRFIVLLIYNKQHIYEITVNTICVEILDLLIKIMINMQVVMLKFRHISKLYQNALTRRPYLTQAIQSGALMGAGDLISQTLIEKKAIKDLDYKRTCQFASIGLFVGGPALRVWYGMLQKYIGKHGKAVALKKVFVDQVIFAPSFLLMILATVGTMQGKNWDTVKTEMKTNYFDVLKTNYLIWPWVQLVNFYYVPLQYQVLIVQSVALFWNTYLSWKTNRTLE